jgi:uncharacterized protein (TIGR02444 family)
MAASISDEAEVEHPFWRFSLAVYSDKAVQAECLDVQERLGADVNLLLFSAYLGAVEGVRLEPRHLADARERVESWHREIVRSLRAARRALKPWSLEKGRLDREAAALRAQVQGMEIRAEQIEQALLWDWLRQWRTDLARAGRREALSANISALLAGYGEGRPDAGPDSRPNLRRAAEAQRSGVGSRGGVDFAPR